MCRCCSLPLNKANRLITAAARCYSHTSACLAPSFSISVVRLPALANPAGAKVVCDFLPDVPSEQLNDELRQAAAADGKRLVANLLAERLPRRLIESARCDCRLVRGAAGRRILEASSHRPGPGR